MKIVLFDWTSGGHHGRYVQRLAEALQPVADVVAAVPARTATELTGIATHVLPGERPLVDLARSLATQHRTLAEAELELFRDTATQLAPDHLVHMYADPVIRRLVAQPRFEARVSLVVFFPRAHYRSMYGARLPMKEEARGLFQAHLLRRWRRRGDAHALLCLDEGAVEWLGRRSGAPVHWLPEPPVQEELPAPVGRAGCVLYGSLAPRKGIQLLAEAMAGASRPPLTILAGVVEPGFDAQLRQAVSLMAAAGVPVELRARHHSEREGLEALAAARCAVLPYPEHFGMSRVLLEAATVGTPVVAHRQGLLGHLVRHNRLGIVVDCRDRRALGDAVVALCEDEDACTRYAEPLARFASRYSSEAFVRRFRTALLPAQHARSYDRPSLTRQELCE